MNQDQLRPELQKAVALYYDGDNAPTLTAKGGGQTAEEIIQLAKEHGVPLCDNAPLVDLLCNLELGDNIPENLYITIAHIISFAYHLKDEFAINDIQEMHNQPRDKL